MTDFAERKREAKRLLEVLRQGNRDGIGIPSTLITFGKAEYLEARPEVEQFLTDPNPEIREHALKVLTLYWYLDEHWKTACDFLEHDPVEDCRVAGVVGLEALKTDTGDRKTLLILAKVVKNENETTYMRTRAYQAMRSIAHFNIEEQKRWMREGFSFEKDVNWSFVNAVLEQGEGERQTGESKDQSGEE